ncbi:hypothetical protein KJ885_04070, partial [Patescibacteria group bacterium]|nr:hypothetical protein [Patescibacteria group bacterium]
LGERRTSKELEKRFGEPIAEVEKKLPAEIKNFELASYRTSGGQSIYFYREKAPLRGKIPDRIWTWKYGKKEGGSEDHGSMLISFPQNLDWREIRVFALAEAYIGSEFHQEERFDSYLALGKHQYHFFTINGSLFSILSASQIDKKMNEMNEELEEAWEDEDGKKPPRVTKKEAKIELMFDKQQEIEARLRPIAHKILWAHQGCTEERIERLLGFDPLENVCGILKIPYFKRPVISAIEWNNHVFKFYSIHGTTNAKKRGSMINAVCNLLDQFERMHFIIMSHQMSGMENVVPRQIRDRVNFMLTTKDQHLVITPSFRRYEGSQEERKGQALPARGSCAMILFSDGNCAFSD